MSEEAPQPPRFSGVQKGLGGLAAGLLLAVGLIVTSEGDRHKAYLDTTKTPTICYGETSGVTLGQVDTQQQCVDLLSADLQNRVALMQQCTRVAVAPEVAGAMIDFAYNAGVHAYCQTPAHLLNEGETTAACNWIGTHYTTSKGVRLAGLVTRRARERTLCLKGTQSSTP